MSKTAMKLALEALETFLQNVQHKKAITALREALAEQQAQQEPKTKQIAECLAVLRPSVKGKFPQEQALEELVGYTTPQPPAQQEPVIDNSCKDAFELIMNWADIYAAQTGCIYSEAAQDPSKASRMADERTMLASVVAQTLSQPAQQPPAQQEPFDVTLEGDEARALYDLLGDDREDLSPVRLLVGDGHSGYGLYVSLAEYQDEGAELIASITPPAPQPAQQEPDRVKFERHWRKTRGEKKANRELPRHPLQPQTYIQDSANRHWVTWQAAVRSVAPSAQLKPLTDEQREEIAKGWRGRNWTVGDIIDATEAAHGIKGDA